MVEVADISRDDEVDMYTKLLDFEIEGLKNEVTSLKREKEAVEVEKSNAFQLLQQQKEKYEGRLQIHSNEIHHLNMENQKMQEDINALWEHYQQKDKDLRACEQWLSTTTE